MEKIMSTLNENLLVKDVMLQPGNFPIVSPAIYLKEALEEMGRSGLGILCVTDEEGILIGILTDGDIRRKLLNIQKPFSAFFIDDVIDHAILTPKVVNSETSLREAIKTMEEKQVWDLPVIDNNGKLAGLLHLHPAVKALLGRE